MILPYVLLSAAIIVLVYENYELKKTITTLHEAYEQLRKYINHSSLM